MDKQTGRVAQAGSLRRARHRVGRTGLLPRRRSSVCVVVGLGCVLGFGTAVAQSKPKPGSIEARLARVERIVGSQALLELVDQVTALRTEVRKLRGQLEEQSHRFSRLERQQRELYSDLDRRIVALDSAGTPVDTPSQVAQESPTPSNTTQTEVAAGALEEQREYQAAFDQLKAGKYPSAAREFGAFLKKYPDGQYADNAQYWLAEAHYVSRNFEGSLKEFKTLVSRYPSSAKVPGARLKIGFIHHELGQTSNARKVLSALIEQYPKSTVGRLARDRLDQIGG
ncbi:MAG: tol-pal system protein YbgF [Gammaproteobacteria bacterium]|nr:tol-pal system protein YbgF [Gammaproteobacteria bacterium]